MEDRFKFRFWDKDRKNWVAQTGNPCLFPFDGRVAMKCNGDGSGHISDDDFSEYYVIQQCTGLKDKNGKLIYEGDIIKTEYDGINGYDAECRKTHIGIVRYESNAYFAKHSIKQVFGRMFGISGDINEVIGNVFENPELLEEKI